MDSGYINHMTAKLETFVNLDKSVNTIVKMGDGTCLESHVKVL